MGGIAGGPDWLTGKDIPIRGTKADRANEYREWLAEGVITLGIGQQHDAEDRDKFPYGVTHSFIVTAITLGHCYIEKHSTQYTKPTFTIEMTEKATKYLKEVTT